jgi:hypothetical protein
MSSVTSTFIDKLKDQSFTDKIVDAERERMIAREQYLMKQRDEFIQMLKEKD